MNKKAVFLDRDGNINRDVGYPHSYDQIEIYSYSFEAVRKINQAGLLAVIITNQSGIGRGLIKEPELWEIHARMKRDFAARQALFNGIYYCPHFLSSRMPLYDRDCRCRKPYTGMALQAASDLGIDLKRSYMVGDKVEDIQFGLNIESKPVLVLTGYGRKSQSRLTELGITPAHVAQNLLDAVNWILEEELRA